MKVIDKKMFFVNSFERDTGVSGDFVITVPSHLLTCQPHQRLRVVLNDLVLPYTWYNVQESNRYFEVVEHWTSLGGVTDETVRIAIDVGSYSALELRDAVALKLNTASGLLLTYSVSFSRITSKMEFIARASVYPPVSFNFTSQMSHLGGSSHKLLGFESSSLNSFADIGDGMLLSSTRSISTMLTDALMLHTDLLNTNVDRGSGDMSSFHLSNVFAKIPINTSPFNNILFTNTNDDYLINITDKRLSILRVWLTTSEHQLITLNDDFSMTLKVEVIEDDEKNLVAQNTGLGELLKLMLLQQRGKNISE